MDDLPFGTRGGRLIRHHFPRDGEYEFRILLMCRRLGECDGSAGFADSHRLLVMVDGLFSTPEYTVTDVRLVEGVSDHKAVVGYIGKK